MIAYIVDTCAKGIFYRAATVNVKLDVVYGRSSAAEGQRAGKRQHAVDDYGHRERHCRARVERPPQQHHHWNGDEQRARIEGGDRHLSRTRVPRIFWLLSALRKFGTSRSISSKYDDSAGVFCCAL